MHDTHRHVLDLSWVSEVASSREFHLEAAKDWLGLALLLAVLNINYICSPPLFVLHVSIRLTTNTALRKYCYSIQFTMVMHVTSCACSSCS